MAYFVQLERSSSFTQIKWIKHALAHSVDLHIRPNLYSTFGEIRRVYILNLTFMGAKMSVLRTDTVFYPISEICNGTVSLINIKLIN